ncbi:MAG: metalloregulator ArsR/SmtB family transcription factor [Dehalococcoidia bacterium]|nr:metalloregulator ArsR/SmtB family transcription factor [Dehalococcoidia bacterium]
MPPALMDAVAERFRALGDPTRLAIVEALVFEGESNVSELVQHLGASQANVSKHLRILHDAGFVARRQEGTSVYYRVEDPGIIQLCDIVCARIREQTEAETRALLGSA